MNYEVIMFVVAFLCSGALVTVYILWLAGLFSNRAKPQSVYTEMIKDAMILSKVEGWLEDEIVDNEDILKDDDYPQNDDIVEGRWECATGLQNMIKQWRSELDITTTK